MMDSVIAYRCVTPDQLQSRTILQIERDTNRCARTQTRIGFVSLNLRSFLTCHTASTTMLTTCPPPDLPSRAPVGLFPLARSRFQRAVSFIDGQHLFGHPKTHSVSIIPTTILPDSPPPTVLKRNGPAIQPGSLLRAFRAPGPVLARLLDASPYGHALHERSRNLASREIPARILLGSRLPCWRPLTCRVPTLAKRPRIYGCWSGRIAATRY